MFNIIRNLGIDLITSSLSVIILNMYFDIFFKRIEHRIRKIIVWGIYFIWQLFISFHKIEPILLNISISIMVAILICICLYEGVWIPKIVFSVIIVLIWVLMEFLTGYIFVLLGIDYMIPVLLGSILSKLMVVFLLLVLKTFFRNEDIKNLPVRYNLILLLVPMGSMYIMYNIFILSMDKGKSTYVEKSIVSLLIILGINVMIFRLYLFLSREKELQRSNTVYVQQIELCNKHIEEKETAMLEFRKTRHDMKQHYIILMQMLNKHQYAAAVCYLQNLILVEKTNSIEISKTENVVVDSLINAKYVLAIKQGIKFECDIHIPMQLPFKGADLSIVIGNVLDNALEASVLIEKDQPFIRYYMKYEKPSLIITVINRYCGKIIRSRDGKIMTNKTDPINHGFGLESVRKVVNKYNGTIMIEEKDDKFILKMVMIGTE